MKRYTIPQLVKKADEAFSKYVRLRDCDRTGNEWHGKCISCNKRGLVAWIDETGKLRFVKGWNAGHFVSRGNKVVRFDEENVNLQCAFSCNNMKSGNIVQYRLALRDKYGDGIPGKLEKLAEETQYYKFTREELEQVISDSKEQIKWYQKEG
jgi:hypothetical protein